MNLLLSIQQAANNAAEAMPELTDRHRARAGA